MDRVTIASATQELSEILVSLDDAYWESSRIDHKDNLYDLIHIFHIELNELSKLSIEDHYMAYEPITIQFRNAVIKIKDLHNNLSHIVLRLKTTEKLDTQLPEIIRLLSGNN